MTRLSLTIPITKPHSWGATHIASSIRRILDYHLSAKAHIDMMRGYNGKHPGEPVRAATVIVNAVESAETPLRLSLGKAALADARKKVGILNKNIGAWSEASTSADGPSKPDR